ncbi:MAG: DUF503 domain-containing protein [Clostridia bacterium]|nr:DUF503 domain-containing protein [Clostridia bacterium]NCC75282.1 DUF503 domain-containing protein [Clostridia bacterium]
MQVAIMQLDLMLYSCHSLKDKRTVTSRLKADLQHRFAVSVAEVAFQDQHSRLGLGLAAAGSDRKTLEKLLQNIENHTETWHDLEILTIEREILVV